MPLSWPPTLLVRDSFLVVLTSWPPHSPFYCPCLLSWPMAQSSLDSSRPLFFLLCCLHIYNKPSPSCSSVFFPYYFLSFKHINGSLLIFLPVYNATLSEGSPSFNIHLLLDNYTHIGPYWVFFFDMKYHIKTFVLMICRITLPLPLQQTFILWVFGAVLRMTDCTHYSHPTPWNPRDCFSSLACFTVVFTMAIRAHINIYGLSK